MRRWFLLWLLCAGRLAAQSSEFHGSTFDPWQLDQWQLEEGLPQNTVAAVARDAQGYLWLATNEGAVRFDGVQFTVFDEQSTAGLRDEIVRRLEPSRSGGMWLATRDGLALLREAVPGVGVEATVYGSGEGLPSTDLQTVHVAADGTVWIGTPRGLLGIVGLDRRTAPTSAPSPTLGGERRILLTTADGLPHDSVWLVEDGLDDDLWIGSEGGLAHWSDGRLTAFGGSAAGLSGDGVLALREDAARRLWVGTFGGLDVIEDGRPRAVEAFRGIPVWVIHEDAAGTLWIGAENGLWRRDGSGLPGGDGAAGTARWISEQRPKALDQRIRVLLDDGEGGLWIGTHHAGLVRLRRRSVQTVGKAEGLPTDLARSVFEDSAGRLWIGSEKGLTQWIDGAPPRHFGAAEGIHGDVLSMVEDGGALLLGTTFGVLRFDDGKVEELTDGEGKSLPRAGSLLLEKGGLESGAVLWIGSHGEGLLAWRDGRIVEHLTLADGLPHERLRDLALDAAGNLWIATDGGVARRAPDGTLESVEELLGQVVSELVLDPDGTLWIGTLGKGLARLRDGRLDRWGIADGLHDDLIYRILDDGERFWMSSNKGVFSVSRKELEGGSGERLFSVVYDERDGMGSRECGGGQQPAGWRARDGRMWFPTLHALAVFEPSRRRSTTTPRVVLEKLVVDNGARRLDLPAELTPGTRSVVFHYTALSWDAPHRLRFYYRLKNFDEDWIDAGNRREAFYTSLPPGEYRFEVRARSREGLWSESPASIFLSQQAAFYQRAPFYAVLISLLAFMAFVGHRLQLRGLLRHNENLRRVQHRLEEKNAEMERFLYAVSHDLKSPLFTIQGYVGGLDREGVDPRRRHADIGRIQKAASRMGRLLDELLEISRIGRIVHPHEDVELSALVGEAVELVAGRLRERGVDLRLDDRSTRVRVDRRRMVEVFQNLLDNATKFFGDQAAPRIEISTRRVDGRVECAVRDNGVGIAPQYQEKIFGLFETLEAGQGGTGVGLALVKRIVELHGGRIWVESAGLGQGATFRFTLPEATGEKPGKAAVPGQDG